MDFIYFCEFPASEPAELLCEGLNSKGITADVINWSDLQISTSGIKYKDNDFVIPRVAMIDSKVKTRTKKNQLRYLYDWLYVLENKGVRFVNSINSVRNSFNKVSAASLLAQHGINTPKTSFASSIKEISDLLEQFGDIIVKPISGHASHRILRITYNEGGKKGKTKLTYPQEIECWHLLEDYKEVCVQEYIPNKGRDLRIEILNNEVISYYAKYANEGDWKVVDINKSTKITPIEITKEIEEISLEAAKALNLNNASIDLVESSKGLVIIEVNSSPTSLYKGIEHLKITKNPNGSLDSYTDLIQELLNKESQVN